MARLNTSRAIENNSCKRFILEIFPPLLILPCNQIKVDKIFIFLKYLVAYKAIVAKYYEF